MVNQFKEKVAIFEAAQVQNDPDVLAEISDWLSENEWPWLDGDQRNAPPSPTRQRGHYIDPETQDLVIIWPEDMNIVPVGQWIVKNRRYNFLEFTNDEDFNYKYEQYGS